MLGFPFSLLLKEHPAMFTTPFSRFGVVAGDSIVCTVDGTKFTARIEDDIDSRPDDFDGYSESRLESWRRDEWYYVGVVIRAERGGVELDNYIASLWGIESDSSPEYLLEIANDLLHEAIPHANEARKRVALALA